MKNPHIPGDVSLHFYLEDATSEGVTHFLSTSTGAHSFTQMSPSGTTYSLEGTRFERANALLPSIEVGASSDSEVAMIFSAELNVADYNVHIQYIDDVREVAEVEALVAFAKAISADGRPVALVDDDAETTLYVSPEM